MGKHQHKDAISIFRILLSTFPKKFWDEFKDFIPSYLASKKLTFDEWGTHMRGDVCVDELAIYLFSVLTNRHTMVMTTPTTCWSTSCRVQNPSDCHVLAYRGGNRFWILVPAHDPIGKICRTKKIVIDARIQELYDASTDEEAISDEPPSDRHDSDFVPDIDVVTPAATSTPKKTTTRSQSKKKPGVLPSLPSPVRTRSRASLERNLRPPRPTDPIPGIPIPAESIASARTPSKKRPTPQRPPPKGKATSSGKVSSTRPKPPKRNRTQTSDAVPSTSTSRPSADDSNLTCTFEGCNRTFAYPSFLRTHLQTHQKSSKKYTCDVVVDGEVCGRKYAYKPDFTRHMRSHTNPTQTCQHEGCNYETAIPKNMTEHEINHEIIDGKRPKPTCKKCGEEFVYRSALSRHQRKCTGPTCDVCLKKFQDIDTYNAHIPVCGIEDAEDAENE